MPCRVLATALVAVTALAVGCGAETDTPLSEQCTASADVVRAALAPAPGPVTLKDGTRLSRCIADGTDDGDLQSVGLAYSRAAEDLAVTARQDPKAAAQLGYLIGATRLGAKRTEGVMAELVRRMELVAGSVSEDAPPPVAAALQQGLRAGEATG